MCLLKVKEDLYSEPVRVKEVRRTRRTYSPERVRTARYSNTRFVEERRPSSYNLPPPQSVPPPPAPPSYSVGPPPDPPAPPPPAPVASSEHVSIKKTESRRESRAPSVRAPSVHQSAIIVETEPPPASYVEVSHEAESPPSSAPSSHDDVRSQSTRRTSNTHKSATTRRSSVSSPKSPAPRSEYSEHEKEYRRERGWSNARRQPEYQTYQYVNAPSNYDRRASRGSLGYRDSSERQIVQRDYWR